MTYDQDDLHRMGVIEITELWYERREAKDAASLLFFRAMLICSVIGGYGIAAGLLA